MIIDWNRCEEHRVIQKDHKKKKKKFYELHIQCIRSGLRHNSPLIDFTTSVILTVKIIYRTAHVIEGADDTLVRAMHDALFQRRRYIRGISMYPDHRERSDL